MAERTPRVAAAVRRLPAILVSAWILAAVLGAAPSAGQEDVEDVGDEDLSEIDSIATDLAQGPGPLSLSLTLSYDESSGNTDTSSLAPRLSVSKFWENDWGVVLDAQATRATSGGETTAESYQLDLAVVRTLSEKVSLVWLDEWHRDVFKGLESQNVVALGALWKAVGRDRWQLTVHGGPGWAEEELTAGAPSHGYLLGVVELSNAFTLSASASAGLTLTYYEDLEDHDNYRFDGDLSLDTAISSRLSISLAYELKYDHQPVDGAATTDTYFNAGLTLTLSGGS